jgi:hypothetical protein
MAVKVFCLPPNIGGYQADGTFKITINFSIYTDTPAVNYMNNSFELNLPLGTNPYSVYSEVFQTIVSFAVQNGFAEPTKADVFGYIPTPFAVLLPDLPAFA